MNQEKNEWYDRIMNAVSSVRKVTDLSPRIAVVLGSGLGDYADQIDVAAEIDYADIAGFPVSTVQGHAGRLIFGTVGGVEIVAQKGRVHYYEGYTPQEVVMPVRLFRQLGVDTLFLTNAAGGINPSFAAGDLMLITDHISCLMPNPLIGPNDDRLGTRFPDMSEAYDRTLCDLIRQVADQHNIPLREGVYCQLTGPSYETPTEVRMLRTLGADAVGMSTAIETIAARHLQMRVAGISCISNLAAGISPVPLTHAEVQETADRVQPLFTRLITETLRAV